MQDFKQRFGQYNAASNSYMFNNVRSGLIVGLVRLPFQGVDDTCLNNSLALNWHSHGGPDRSSICQ